MYRTPFRPQCSNVCGFQGLVADYTTPTTTRFSACRSVIDFSLCMSTSYFSQELATRAENNIDRGSAHVQETSPTVRVSKRASLHLYVPDDAAEGLGESHANQPFFPPPLRLPTPSRGRSENECCKESLPPHIVFVGR